MSSVVYFIRNVVTGSIKIGISRRLKSRISQLQTAHSDELELLGAIVGGAALEKELHQRWAHLRVRGEWFASSPDLMLGISSLLAERGCKIEDDARPEIDPHTVQARDWAIFLLEEAGSASAFADVAQQCGVSAGLIENLYRRRLTAITVRDHEAIRLVYISSVEGRLQRLRDQLEMVGASTDAEGSKAVLEEAQALHARITAEAQ